MKEYIFILGRDPELSMLELKSYLDIRGIEHKIIAYSKKAALLKLPEMNFGAVINDLGGISKIARVFKYLAEEELFNIAGNKMNYAVSVYDDTDTAELKAELKLLFREQKIKATLKNPAHEDDFLGPSEVVRHNLILHGFEIVAYDGLYGRTIAVSNSLEYEKRDKARPVQRPLQMVSIRLAKILINLSGAKPGLTVLDPFCGIGVILQEAMLMNINSIGIDSDPEMAAASTKNTGWTRQMSNSNASCKVIHADSTKKIEVKADAVASEPYMGPLLRKIPTEKEAIEIMAKLRPLYNYLLCNLKNNVRGRIAIIMPRFRLYSGKRISADFAEIANKNGYKASSIIPGIKFPITYLGQRAIIDREIWVIEKI